MMVDHLNFRYSLLLCVEACARPYPGVLLASIRRNDDSDIGEEGVTAHGTAFLLLQRLSSWHFYAGREEERVEAKELCSPMAIASDLALAM